MSQSEYDAAIAAFIRSKGITRCPTACVVRTQGTVKRVGPEGAAATRGRGRNSSRPPARLAIHWRHFIRPLEFFKTNALAPGEMLAVSDKPLGRIAAFVVVHDPADRSLPSARTL